MAALLATVGMAAVAAQQQTILRGRVERVASGGHRVPVANIRVAARDSATRRVLPAVYTGRDGFYYVSGASPARTYSVDVSAPGRRAPLRFKVRTGPRQYTDVRPIVIQ